LFKKVIFVQKMILDAKKPFIYYYKISRQSSTVNLQRTKFHKKADIVIHEKIDAVLKKLCENLEIEVVSS